jgi:hypothetical protein
MIVRRLIAWFGVGRLRPPPAVPAVPNADAAFDLDEFGRLLSSGKPEDLKEIARAMTLAGSDSLSVD